jgi:hypothetical protein
MEVTLAGIVHGGQAIAGKRAFTNSCHIHTANFRGHPDILCRAGIAGDDEAAAHFFCLEI